MYVKIPQQPRETVIIKVYASTTCPTCQSLLAPESPFNQAIKEAKKDKNIDIQLEIIYVDPHINPTGYLKFKNLKLDGVPTIFINGKLIDFKYYFDKEAMLKIIRGEKPVARQTPIHKKSPIPKLRLKWRR